MGGSSSHSPPAPPPAVPLVTPESESVTAAAERERRRLIQRFSREDTFLVDLTAPAQQGTDALKTLLGD